MTIETVLITFQENIDRLTACTDDSYILAWDNGLGVRFVEPGKPVACSLWAADAIVTQQQADKMPEDAWAFTPIVRNGNGEQAKLVTRQAAIARELEEARQHLAFFSAKAAAQ